MKIDFIKSAASLRDCPAEWIPEIALAGRSNAGKSSFLNAMAGQKVAQVSGQPGKTRLLNFFAAGENYRIVDMPGYGYAARSRGERGSWKAMVEDFLSLRDQLVGMLLIMDCRRSWLEEEEMLFSWLQMQGLPLALILNKVDKLNNKELAQRKRDLAKELNGKELPSFWVSSVKKTGLKEVEEYIFRQWIQPALAAGK